LIGAGPIWKSPRENGEEIMAVRVIACVFVSSAVGSGGQSVSGATPQAGVRFPDVLKWMVMALLRLQQNFFPRSKGKS
jgi:hypothetical protein